MKLALSILLFISLGCAAQPPKTHVKGAFMFHHYGIHDTSSGSGGGGGFLTADEYVPPYTGTLNFGNNPGYYGYRTYHQSQASPQIFDSTRGTVWSDDSLAGLMARVLLNSWRGKLTDQFVYPGYLPDYTIRATQFANYGNIDGLFNLTCITGEQPAGVPRGYTTLSDGSGPNGHIDTAHYYPCPTRDSAVVVSPGDTVHYTVFNKKAWVHSYLFVNLYHQIWDTLPDGSVTPHPDNYCAVYYYNLCKVYGPYIKFWEVVNEPDYSGGAAPQWAFRMPKPQECYNVFAPLPMYIRELQVAYTVIKHYYPNSYVCAGGMGYYQYFDALLRYTANPGTSGADSAGSKNAIYTKTGGAFMDGICFHVYPYYTQHWNNSIHAFNTYFYSDSCANEVGKYHDDFWNTALKYGYDGIHKPKKLILLSETNVSARRTQSIWGSDSLQVSFAMKVFCRVQKKGDVSMHFFTTGDHQGPWPTDSILATNYEYNAMGLYNDLEIYDTGQVKVNQTHATLHNEGIAVRTVQTLLGSQYGWRYDSVETHLRGFTTYLMPGQIPGWNATIDGCAWVNIGHGNERYMIWARTGGNFVGNVGNEAPIDPNAKYSFPSTWHHVWRYEWDFAKDWKNPVPPTPAYILAQNIPINSTPSIFEFAD